MELQGTIKIIFETQEFDSGFKKREFVVTTDGDYPQDIKFEFIKDKVDILDKYSEGQRVDVSFDIRGNEYNGKYYNNLQAWKVFAVEGASTKNDRANDGANDGASDKDDLPF
jgi:hypothetical protein